MFAVQRSDAADSLLSVYAVRRPDHRWSLLLVNRDPTHPRLIDPRIAAKGSGGTRPLRGPIDIWQYSSEQYEFKEDGENGHPVKNLPPKHNTTRSGARVTLPPYSVTVISAT
jgi:hypothetical protein